MLMRLLLATLLLLSGPLAAQTQLETFELQHRPADDLLPLLRPLLSAEGSASGRDSVLLIRDTPDVLEALRAAVSQLDTPRQQLRIIVTQGVGDDQVSHGTGADGKSNVRVYSTGKRGGAQSLQQLTMLEGNWARIGSGEAIPVPKQTTVATPGGVMTQQSIEYRDVMSGFEVRPRVQGEQVTLDVRPFLAGRASQGGGAIEQQDITTQVSGHVGEWLEIGGAVESTATSGRGSTYSTRSRENTDRRVRLKVELLTR